MRARVHASNDDVDGIDNGFSDNGIPHLVQSSLPRVEADNAETVPGVENWKLGSKWALLKSRLPEISRYYGDGLHGSESLERTAGVKNTGKSGNNVRNIFMAGIDKKKAADNVELVEQLHKALSDRHVERVHFMQLFAFLGFLLLYLTVLAMQQPSQQQHAITSVILDELLPIGNNGMRTTEFQGKEELYDWLETKILQHWTPTSCGDGRCDAPTEFPAFGRWGCQADCGSANVTEVDVVLRRETKRQGAVNNFQVCHATAKVANTDDPLCWEEALDVGELTTTSDSVTQTMRLPDGHWIMYLSSVGGSGSNFFGGLNPISLHPTSTDAPSVTNATVPSASGPISTFPPPTLPGGDAGAPPPPMPTQDTSNVTQQQQQEASPPPSVANSSLAPPPTPARDFPFFWGDYLLTLHEDNGQRPDGKNPVPPGGFDYCKQEFLRVGATAPANCLGRALFSNAQCCPLFKGLLENNCFCTTIWTPYDAEGLGLYTSLGPTVEDSPPIENCESLLGLAVKSGSDCDIPHPREVTPAECVDDMACYYYYKDLAGDSYIESNCWHEFLPQTCCPALVPIIENRCLCGSITEFSSQGVPAAFHAVVQGCIAYGYPYTIPKCEPLHTLDPIYTPDDQALRKKMYAAKVSRASKQLGQDKSTALLVSHREATNMQELLESGVASPYTAENGVVLTVCKELNYPFDCGLILEYILTECNRDMCSEECSRAICFMDLLGATKCGNRPVALQIDVVKNAMPFYPYELWSKQMRGFATARGQQCLSNQTDSLSQCANTYNPTCMQEVRTTHALVMECLAEAYVTSDANPGFAGSVYTLEDLQLDLQPWTDFLFQHDGYWYVCAQVQQFHTAERVLDVDCHTAVKYLSSRDRVLKSLISDVKQKAGVFECDMHTDCSDKQFCGLMVGSHGNATCLPCEWACLSEISPFRGVEPIEGTCECPVTCAPGCETHMLRNAECDPVCFNEACGWDSMDCANEMSLQEVSCPEDTAEVFWSEVVHDSKAACCYTENTRDTQIEITLNNHNQVDIIQQYQATPFDPSIYVGTTNRIIGGLLLHVSRFSNSDCSSTLRFNKLYSLCRGEVNTMAYGMDPVFQFGSSLFRGGTKLVQDKYYNQSELNQFGVPFGFRHEKIAGYPDGFPVVFDTRLLPERAADWVSYLREGNYFDHQTRSMDFQLVTFNGNFGVFSNVRLSFLFSEAGSIKISHEIVHITVEQYVSNEQLLRLALELALIPCLLINWWKEGKQFVRIFRKTNRVDAYLFANNQYNLIDTLSILLFTVVISMWVTLVIRTSEFDVETHYDVYSDLKADGHWLALADDGQGLSNLADKFDDISTLAQWNSLYLSLNGINILLMLFRLLKYMDFHPDIGMITRTLTEAGNDMVNFVVLCFMIIFIYAQMGVVLFGSHVGSLSTTREALNTCLLAMMGEFGGLWDDLSGLKSVWQIWSVYMYFWSYMVLVYLNLLNALLAIIVSAMSQIKDKGTDSKTFIGEVCDILRYVSSGPRNIFMAMVSRVFFGKRYETAMTEDSVQEQLSRWIDKDELARQELDEKLQILTSDEVEEAKPNEKFIQFGIRPLGVKELEQMLKGARDQVLARNQANEAASSGARFTRFESGNPKPKNSISKLRSASVGNFLLEKVGPVANSDKQVQSMSEFVYSIFARDRHVIEMKINKLYASKPDTQEHARDARTETWRQHISDEVARNSAYLEKQMELLKRLEGKVSGGGAHMHPMSEDNEGTIHI